MAKWRPIGSDSSHVTFEQLETSFESNTGHENEEQIQRSNDSNETRHRVSQRTHSQTNGSQIQRSRNHYSSGHYCNIHQTHHQYHQSSHSSHSSHCSHWGHSSQCCHSSHSNHNHIHNNRNNSHPNQCNQELATNEELDSQSSHTSHGLQQPLNYTLDQTEFERIWRQLDSNRDRYHFLQTLYRSSGNLVFSEISFGSLGDIASALCEFDETVDDFVFVIYILNSLSRAKRFLLSLQFLTLEERVECKKLFIRLWKGMNDIRQDLAENDISELTINALMKAYEIDIDS